MRYIRNVVTLNYLEEKCIGCGMCKTVCPHNVFRIENGKAVINDKDLCMECGACMINCPVDALYVKKGVGCAAAIIQSKLRGSKEISCNCDSSERK